jgi:hypothetical protein
VLKTNQALPEPEELLLDYAQRLAHHRAGRKALFLTLSALAPTPHADDHWHVVENLLTPIIRRRGGELFRLQNGDVATILRSADRELTERLTLKLRYLFRDDPLVVKEEGTGAELLCKWFDLNDDYEAFLAFVRAIEARSHEGAAPAALLAETPELATGGAEFRGPRDLRQSPLIRWLIAPPSAPRAMDRLAEASPVARLRPGETPQPAFELFAPQPHALLPLGFPETDLERNPSLTEALRALAARRLLIELPSARRPNEPIAVTLTLDGLLGTELLALHRAWALAQWTPLTFLVEHEEFLAEPKRYRYVRQMLKELGHRLGFTNVPLELLTQRTRTEADIVALAWQLDFGDGTERRFAALSEALGEGRGADVLVTQVHNREALSFARKIGAGLVAGRQAAKLLGKS